MLSRYVKLLERGELVAFPTETVYGLGADAWNPSAIQKVFEQKGRPADNPLIVHISNRTMVDSFAQTVPPAAEKLMTHFWPGPLTLIFDKKPEVLDILTGGLDTVAIRWPRHPLSQELIAQAGALVAPSANSSGKPSPTKPKHVKEDFGKKFPVIAAGETDIGLESTVLDVSSEPFRIYRPGAISAEQISKVAGKKVERASQPSANTEARSPGTKYTHYSPDATVQWLKDDLDSQETLYLLHTQYDNLKAENIVHYKGNFREMAHELFDRFRQADFHGFHTVLIEPFSAEQLQKPLVRALQNRISKAVS
ncbi:L-threonylcarbamoyladenylate synthase [Fodinibius halophilus]|uniref:L-threonylcarbamoyladenylate synthase n=1 Tax=Fodinibius halophilus TaxID=1736908 RepID=UPI00197A93D3|nr:L-threonylcarbamoyladenylate synthase [Fodinibius halophilus]